MIKTSWIYRLLPHVDPRARGETYNQPLSQPDDFLRKLFEAVVDVEKKEEKGRR